MNSLLDRTLEQVVDPIRLATLYSTELLDSSAEECFDRFTRLATKILHTPVSLVSLVDKDRQFFKSQVGLLEPWKSQRETPLSHSFCQYVVASAQPLIVNDARDVELLKNNLAIPELGVIAYLGIPLTTLSGQTLGAFCTIDAKPRQWNDTDITLIKDLAAIVMTEIELRILARTYREKYRQLKHLEDQRDSMVHMLVHDLRNPLTSLMAGVELMAIDQELTPLQQSAFDATLRGGQQLMIMINDILDVSKTDVAAMEIKRSPVDFNRLLVNTYEEIRPLATRQNIALNCYPATDLGTIFIDESKVHRVLVNLIANAIQHTPNHGQIDISCRLLKRTLELKIDITDTGCGISLEDQALIFERFWSSHKVPANDASTGLGLTFCKLACEAHGGTITVTSQLGHGSTFTITLPVIQ